jgi:hypothetical protein
MDDQSNVGGFSYSMFKSGPDVSADEVESRRSAIEVMVLWGSSVVHVSHLAPPRPFCVGEDPGCDCFIPSEALGRARAPLVASDGRRAALVILPGSRGHVDIPGHGRIGLADLIASGCASPSTEVSGAYEYELPAQAKARIELEKSIVFQVSATRAGKRVPGGLFATTEPEALLYMGLSFLLHAGIVVVLAFFMPSMRSDDGEALSRDRILTMQKLLNAAADREQEQRDPQEVTEDAPERKTEGGTGASAVGEAGAMGTPSTRDAGHKYGVQGPQDNPDPHLAKAAALDEAARFGMIGLVSTMAGGDPNAPTAPWGREESLGRDARSALGNLFGDRVDDSYGTNGLSLTGVDEGGGGRGEGIGLRNFGPLGHGGGPGTDQGIGVGQGRPGGGHQVRPPHMREPGASINGRLPAEVIQRIVRQNFGRFRYCYEKGMRNDPSLQGRVTVKFIIDRSGAVAMSADGGSDLPDQGVVHCIVGGFSNLSFPAPEGGMVTVVYPIVFSPGD